MRTLTAILFVLGCGWALVAWVVVVLPVGILLPPYRYTPHDTAFSIAGSILALIGYWIWFGWGFRWKTGRYPMVSQGTFWMISLCIHLVWAFALPFGCKESFEKFWSHGHTLPFRSWILINIIISIIALLMGPENPCGDATKPKPPADP